MTSFFFIQPAFMLSGFTFPIRNMPLPIQWLTYLNPLRYFMDIVRGVFLKGAGIDAGHIENAAARTNDHGNPLSLAAKLVGAPRHGKLTFG